jgi:hypothetical protein
MTLLVQVLVLLRVLYPAIRSLEPLPGTTTLFTSSTMQDHFSWTYDYKKRSQHTAINITNRGRKILLQYLSNKNKLPEMNCDINIHTFTATLRKWSEGTSTSPSGRHMGHYKCLLINDKHESQHTKNNLDPKDKIMDVYYKIATTALRVGVSLTTVIEKIPGNPKINKL